MSPSKPAPSAEAPLVPPAPWSNWAKTYRAEPALRAAPADLDGLVAAVRAAAARELPIRVAGTGHSLMPLARTPGALITTEHLRRVLRIDGDVIEVEAGAHLVEVEEAAWEVGLSLEGGTNYGKMSVGGVVATGAHGSSPTHGTLSSRVVGVRLVTAAGEVVTIDATRPDELRAARLHLGLLGAVYALRLRCEPAFHLRVDYRSEPLDRAIADVGRVLATHEHVSLYWYPGSKRAWWYLADRAPGPATLRPWRKVLRHAQQIALNQGAGGLIFPLVKRVPRLTHPLLALGDLTALRVRGEVRRSLDAYHYLQATPAFIDAAHVLPVEHAGAALGETFALLARHARRGSYPINMAVQLRRIGPDDAWLSPTLGRTSAVIECVAAPGTPGAEGFYRELDALMGERFGALPHWGKLFEVPRLAAYGSRRVAFEAVRADLDPRGAFLGELGREVLGPAAARGAA